MRPTAQVVSTLRYLSENVCREYRKDFTARYTIVQSAVLRLHVVCPSVCLSVTVVDHDHIG